jgi:uncharacterized protein
MKFLLILIVILAVIWLMRRGSASRHGRKRQARPNGASQVRPMVECAHCGVHLPADEAVIGSEGRTYCSEAHRVAGPA